MTSTSDLSKHLPSGSTDPELDPGPFPLRGNGGAGFEVRSSAHPRGRAYENGIRYPEKGEDHERGGLGRKSEMKKTTPSRPIPQPPRPQASAPAAMAEKRHDGLSTSLAVNIRTALAGLTVETPASDVRDALADGGLHLPTSAVLSWLTNLGSERTGENIIRDLEKGASPR